MVTVVVRVWMPDRPGALGQVASRIGAVRGDVLGIEILEQGAGRVIDELTVELPEAELMPLLTAEIGAVDGVAVEDVRVVDPDRVDPNLAALALGGRLLIVEPWAAGALSVDVEVIARGLGSDGQPLVLRAAEPIGWTNDGAGTMLIATPKRSGRQPTH